MSAEGSPSVRLYFRLYGLDFDPAEVTRRLEIEPTEQFRVGEVGSGRSAPHRRDGWMIKVGPRNTLDIADMLSELRTRVDIPGEVVKQVCNDLDIEAVIVCAVVQPPSAPTPTLEFPSSFLQWIADFGASINVDVICPAADPP